MDLHVQVLGVVEEPRDDSLPGNSQAQVGHTSVKVERAKQAKPFLGGYRHGITGVEYHHATAQTMSNRRHPDQSKLRERDAQTVVSRNKYQQVTADAATQMQKTGCYISNCPDKIIISQKYETADEYHKRILGKIIVLQSYWRRWLAKRYVDGLRRDKLKRDEWEMQEVIRKQKERDDRIKREFERRMNPKTKEDFDILYHALEMWRQDELKHINSSTSGPERKAALCELLEKEAELIASIGRHKNAAHENNREGEMKAFLEKTAAPKRWYAFDGGTTEMDTPYTLRAQQLRDIYNTITLKGLSRDERLDVLLTLKSTVKEHDCTLTRDIVQLADREADLLMRKTPDAALYGLRKRISSLFFQYCKTPLFNPEAARHIKIPQDPMSLCNSFYYCRGCCQYLPSTDFELSTNSKVTGHCRSCCDMDNRARARLDLTLYRGMLASIRKEEEAHGDSSRVAFLIQESDLCYLVEDIWGGQSALSASDDPYELTLGRWDSKEQWSPWNCILLTKDEVVGHNRLDDVHESYGAEFIRKVNHRHVLAKNHFSSMPALEKHLEPKIKALPLPRPKEHVISARVPAT
eukprot:Em0004g974a